MELGMNYIGRNIGFSCNTMTDYVNYMGDVCEGWIEDVYALV